MPTPARKTEERGTQSGVRTSEMITVLALDKAVGPRGMVSTSDVPLAPLPVGKVSPSSTPKSKPFWPFSQAWRLIYLQSRYSVGSGPEAGQMIASHAESAILPSSQLAFLMRGLRVGKEEGGHSVDW